jgi:hypothetical protein
MKAALGVLKLSQLSVSMEHREVSMLCRRSFRVSLVACIVVLACNGSQTLEPVTPYVTIVASPPRVAAGGSLSITITNHSSFVLSFNPCSNFLLEVLTQDGWRVVADPKPCTDELRGVLPRTDYTVAHPLPARLAIGAYRIRIDRLYVKEQFGSNDGLVPSGQLTSNAFAVN